MPCRRCGTVPRGGGTNGRPARGRMAGAVYTGNCVGSGMVARGLDLDVDMDTQGAEVRGWPTWWRHRASSATKQISRLQNPP